MLLPSYPTDKDRAATRRWGSSSYPGADPDTQPEAV
jgi:hypothetical protein